MVPSLSFKVFAGFFVLLCSESLCANGCYPSIISFGDSITDTGNLKLLASISDARFPCASPYGQNFIRQFTGRCSNGRLIIDFLAESLGLPLIPPYLYIEGRNRAAALKQGVNYAVGGSTALYSSFFLNKWTDVNVGNTSLEVQFAWFKKSLASICGNVTSPDCRFFIGRSLILMGEIGGNDYNIPLSKGKSIDEVQTYVPLIINTIASTINELIEMGARTIVVPGNFPIGCSPSYLATRTHDEEDYDPITGCLTKLNKFVEYHNEMLQTKLNEIRKANPDVILIYADYYNAAMQFYLFPVEYGFTNGVLKACCGSGGPFNYNATALCGDAFSTVCDEPDTYISWDGVHYTEAAYKMVFKNVFQGPYTTPEFDSLCLMSTSQVAME